MDRKKAQIVKVTSKTSVDSYDSSRFNAVRHGVLSKHTVLPWEDEDEYRDLLNALVAEHAPVGPTEEHLVEELAGIFWRKRRLRLAEGASHCQGLRRTIDQLKEDVAEAALAHTPIYGLEGSAADAVKLSDADVAGELEHLKEYMETIDRAAELAESKRSDPYKDAFHAVDQETRDWWARAIAESADEEPDSPRRYDANAVDFGRFLRTDVVRWVEARCDYLRNRPLIARQAFGESFDPAKLERLSRYEVHLDRKLERTLTMLVKLQQLRRQSQPA